MTSEMNNVVSWKLRRTFWYKYVKCNGQQKRQYNCTKAHGFMSYCNVHDSPPPLHTLSQTNPCYAIPNDLLKILSNILLPSMPSSSKWSLSFNFSAETVLSYTSYVIYSSYFILFDLTTCMIFGEDYRL